MLSRENNADGYMQNKEDSARIMDFATRRIDAGFLVFFCVNSCCESRENRFPPQTLFLNCMNSGLWGRGLEI